MKVHRNLRPVFPVQVFIVMLLTGLHPACDKIPFLKKKYDVNMQYGKKAFANRNYKTAIQHFKKAVFIHNQSQEAQYFLGYTLDYNIPKGIDTHLSTDLDFQLRSLKQFKKVIAIAPWYEGERLILDSYSKITSIWGNLAMAYWVKGETDSARWALNQGKKDGGFRDALLEYNRNIMTSCERNAILFTNGDMDTYPMLYLQLIDQYRTDITVLNLSLLNAAWYIRMSRNSPPGNNSVPVFISDTAIDSLSPIFWKARELMIEIPGSDGRKADEMIWNMKPTFSDSLLRVQDLMVMQILENNRWQHPVYFSTTVSRENRIGLDAHLAIEGLVLRLAPGQNNSVTFERLTQNVLKNYSYQAINWDETRNLQDVIDLAQNYRFSFLRIVQHELTAGNVKGARDIFQQMEVQLPETVLPYANEAVKSAIVWYKEQLQRM